MRIGVTGSVDDSSDEELVARIARGDAAAFASLVLRHADRSVALAERMTGQRGAAEDAVQEAFTRLWRKADSFDPAQARFTTWFYRVVVNACTDGLRRQRRTESLPDGWDMPDPDPDAEADLARAQRAQAVRRALDELPARQRVAVVLCYFDGMSNAQAAEILELRLKALEALLVRARRTLRRILDDTAEGDDR